MHVVDFPLRIAQFGDIHCGEQSFDPVRLTAIIDEINNLAPDVVVVDGDLTGAGYEWEFQEAARHLDRLEHPMIVVPGNHDSRNVGYVHFENIFGDRFSSHRQVFDPLRAQALDAEGLTVVAIDSSEPDVNEGHVGREHYPWIREQLSHPKDISIFVIHHHLVSIPGTGRERNIITDAGDILALLTELEVDIVLSGHKHVPFFWGVNGILICNAGTATTKRVRGLTPPSWNEIIVDASTIKVCTHYEDRCELSLIFSRKTRAMTREALYLTDDFLTSNRISALTPDA